LTVGPDYTHYVERYCRTCGEVVEAAVRYTSALAVEVPIWSGLCSCGKDADSAGIGKRERLRELPPEVVPDA
jgi:hypothetical protein